MRRDLLFLGLVVAVAACQPANDEAASSAAAAEATATAEPAQGTPEAKIAEAMKSAPQEIAANATILDWPATEGGEMAQLRAGTNGWTCFPSSPAALEAGRKDSVCLDGSWVTFFEAWMAKKPPAITTVGFAYMLQGDGGSSATDPFAMAETPDNNWVVSGPHVMVVVPDPKALEGLPDTPDSGGPWVMWAGTPWAHVMTPVGPGR